MMISRALLMEPTQDSCCQEVGETVFGRAALQRSWFDILAVALTAALCVLPNLGAHSLWDVDEARNAECAREMWEAGDWIVPTFNYELRTDKPILPYWLIMLSYERFGVSEWSARLPSALAGIATCILTYGLGWSMFGRWMGFLAGTMLASAILFNVLSHAVTPDALLILWTTAALTSAWLGIAHARPSWLAWFGLFTGLATLTKGLVGILLPMTAVGLFLIWERKLSLLWNRWLVWGIVLWLVVTLPWYIAVGVATKGEWLVGFFGRHHVERFTTPLEGHRGGIWYHPLGLLIGFAPWSAWLVVALTGMLVQWYRQRSQKRAASESSSSGTTRHPASALRFLACWCATWLIFFSLAQTKLPNYVAPIYPALALVTSMWLVAWMTKQTEAPGWMIATTLAVWGLIGVGVSVGILVASGVIFVPVLEGRTIPDLARLSWLGLIPVLGATLAAWAWHRGRYLAVAGSCLVSGVGFVAVGAAYGPTLVHSAKIAHRFGEAIRQTQSEPEIRVACYGWFQPSIVFYVQRRVANLREVHDAQDWLEHPLESYLIVSRPWWEERLLPTLRQPHTILASYWDFTRAREILLVKNRGPESASARCLEPIIARPGGDTSARGDARLTFRVVALPHGPVAPEPEEAFPAKVDSGRD
ncbi:MAG: glycosyltransferase family 39 protein [Gemmatales bacterium]|nr:glycosyltransferase family 39 protein [Gemmatales bacterium]MDW8223925.1 glycosyltransferase family 39 protein [Gemmatales bacterium]